jgi:hypothetical protein
MPERSEPRRPTVLPDWVPVGVLDTAAARIKDPDYADNPSAIGLIERLTIDPRMKKVWDLLRKQTRPHHSGTAYAHPATIPQDQAMQFLFFTAVVFYLRPVPRIVTRRMVEERRRRLRDLAGRLREEGRELVELDVGARDQLCTFWDLAAECEHRADAPPAAMLFDRDRGDLWLRAWLIYFSHETKRLFGNPLYRTVATIASVAFERDVTVDMVRHSIEARIMALTPPFAVP